MGQAIITGGGPTGLYNITVVKHAGKSAARLVAIAARLTALVALISTATSAVEAAIVALTAAQEVLNASISYTRTPKPTLTAVARWYNDGNGTCTNISPGPSCQEGVYTLTFGASIPGDYSTSPVVPDSLGWSVSTPTGSLPNGRIGAYASSEINFTTASGSTPFAAGDAFDIEVTEVTRIAETPVTTATKAVLTAQATLTQKRRDLALINVEQSSLTAEQARLTAAMAVEAKTGIWCTDLTENLAVGATVGTMEMNGVDDQIILAPGGVVSKSIGLLQHVGVSSPSAVFLNKARLPGWQKWKPTHRVGTITAINYATDKCDVGIEAQFSEERGLPINQAGAAYEAIKAAVAGWSAFAAANPSFALVTNTASTNLTLTPQVTSDLASVNDYVNSRYNYKTDTQQYAKLENWALMELGGSGDCEDFALTKAQRLLNMGYPASALHIEIGLNTKGEGHAWLVVQTDKGDFALDNSYKNPVPNGSTPYTARQRQTGMNWNVSGVKLSAVPIEYMDGIDSSVFVVGDRVVVQFVGQNWTAPKVVGFESWPRGGNEMLVVLEANYTGNPWPYYLWTTRVGGSYNKSPITNGAGALYGGGMGGSEAIYYSYNSDCFIIGQAPDYTHTRLVKVSRTGEILAQKTVGHGTTAHLTPWVGYARLPSGEERFGFCSAFQAYVYDENLSLVDSYVITDDSWATGTFMMKDGTKKIATSPGVNWVLLGATRDGTFIWYYGAAGKNGIVKLTSQDCSWEKILLTLPIAGPYGNFYISAAEVDGKICICNRGEYPGWPGWIQVYSRAGLLLYSIPLETGLGVEAPQRMVQWAKYKAW